MKGRKSIKMYFLEKPRDIKSLIDKTFWGQMKK